MTYASEDAQRRKRPSPGPDARRNQSKVHHARQSKATGSIAKRSGARLETNRETRSGHPQSGDGQILKLYNELLFAVVHVSPGETRHQTALRYIREAEEAGFDAAWEEAKRDRLAEVGR